MTTREATPRVTLAPLRSLAFASAVLAVIIGGCATPQTMTSSGQSVEFPDLGPYTHTGKEPKVAVVDFENNSFFESKVLGKFCSDMFETALVQSNRFFVIDRKRLLTVIEEKKLGMTGLTADNGAALAQMTGAEYLVTGSITEFGIKRTGTSLTGGAVNFATMSGGGAQIKSETGTARIVIDVKIISVATGQVVYMNSAKGEAASGSFGLGVAMLTGGLSAVGGGIKAGNVGFDETTPGIAARLSAYHHLELMVKQNPFGWGR